MWGSLVPQALFGNGELQDLFAAWSPSGGQQTEAWMSLQDRHRRASAATMIIGGDGTDTDTSSGDGLEELPDPGIRHMSEEEAAEHIYMMYRRAEMTWRRCTDRPVRRFQRAFQHSKGRRQRKRKEPWFLLHE